MTINIEKKSVQSGCMNKMWIQVK